jgi:hypothetical protein
LVLPYKLYTVKVQSPLKRLLGSFLYAIFQEKSKRWYTVAKVVPGRVEATASIVIRSSL